MNDYLNLLKQKLDTQTQVKNESIVTSAMLSEAFDETPTHDPAIKQSVPEPLGNAPQQEVKKERQFFLTQSLIKDVTTWNGDYTDTCPRLIYEKYITGQYRYTTDSMMEGVFGETLFLGKGAKGQLVTDLPRHKNTGEKLSAQKNIEEQARRFNLWCVSKGISVIRDINTQFPIVKKFNDKILIRTEIDIFPSPFLHQGEYKLAVIDLKLTGNIHNTGGKFSWGAPQFIDHLQADMTYWILEDFDMDLNIAHCPEKEDVYKAIFENDTIIQTIKDKELMFIYFIVGYKSQPLDKQILFYHREYYEQGESRNPNSIPKRQREWKERARKTLAQLNMWHQQKWKPEPSNLCIKCPVNKANGGYCNVAATIQTI